MNSIIAGSTFSPTFAARSVTTPAIGARDMAGGLERTLLGPAFERRRRHSEQGEARPRTLDLGCLRGVLGVDAVELLLAGSADAHQLLCALQFLIVRTQTRHCGRVPGVSLGEFGTIDLGQGLPATNALTKVSRDARHTATHQGRHGDTAIGVRLDDGRYAQCGSATGRTHRLPRECRRALPRPWRWAPRSAATSERRPCPSSRTVPTRAGRRSWPRVASRRPARVSTPLSRLAQAGSAMSDVVRGT